MIVTVTPNTAVDRVLFVEDFSFGHTVRAKEEVLAVGGKAADAAVVVKALGQETVVMGFVAGREGEEFVALLEERGIPHDLIWVEGRTRTAFVLVDISRRAQSTIVADTLRVRPEDVDLLEEKVCRAARSASYVLIGGTLPPGAPEDTFARLLRAIHVEGAKTLLDTGGKLLRDGLEARPYIVKANTSEVGAMLGRAMDSPAEVRRAAQEILERGAEIAVITMGPEGAIALVEGEAYRAWPPSVEVVNTAGSGDAMAAGLSVALSEGRSLAEALRLAMAAAAAVLITPGTAECRLEDVNRLLSQVRIEEI